MMPIFLFIGIGIFISLDILQPSMFRNLDKYYPLIIMATLVGTAPIILITSAINSLMTEYIKGAKYAMYFVISLIMIFMASEIIYSYISIQGFFIDMAVPITKIVGIMCLPFTFSLYYFVSLVFEKINKKNQSKPISAIKKALLEEREETITQLKIKGLEIQSLEN